MCPTLKSRLLRVISILFLFEVCANWCHHETKNYTIDYVTD